MRLVLCSVCVPVAVFSLTWGASEAQARRAGLTESACTGCHGTRAAELDVSFDPPVTEPNQTTTVTLKVRGDTLAVAGMAVSLPAGGQFSIPEGEPLSVSGVWVLHNQPKPAVDGEVTFHFDWTSPSEVGSGAYTAAALAANDNRVQTGDSTASTSGRIAYGCEAVTLYRDIDGDGVGVTSQFLTDCVGLDGFVAAAGDCDDNDAAKYPGAPESCNDVDDDCDDAIDEEVVDQAYYLDEDADGFGYAEDSMLSCTPVAGYVLNALDCNWKSSGINPNATEICDLVDNDCDEQVDEGFEVYCGSGECRRRGVNCLLTCVPGEPSAELCNGLDDDCDEQVDEDACDDGAPSPSVNPENPENPEDAAEPPRVTDTAPQATSSRDAGRADDPSATDTAETDVERDEPSAPSSAGTSDADAALVATDGPPQTSSPSPAQDGESEPQTSEAGCAVTWQQTNPSAPILALLGLGVVFLVRRHR